MVSCIHVHINKYFLFQGMNTFLFVDKPMHTAKKIQIRILDLQS